MSLGVVTEAYCLVLNLFDDIVTYVNYMHWTGHVMKHMWSTYFW
jgi:hypothetical protein